MSDILRLVMCLVAYMFLFGSAACVLAKPAVASDYVGNFERIPLVENRPPQVGFWKLPPTIIVCESAPISNVQIRSAVRFWERLGYEFKGTRYKSDPLNKCLSDTPEGFIVIHLITEEVKMEPTSLAQTHFYVDNNTSEIKWAVIYMRSDIRETILEHELGHALGYLHFNRINHLMNEKWTMGGWDKEGLESKHR